LINERASEWTASQKLRVLDLFSGIGGFSLGLERTGGFETIAFCEIDPFCRRVLAKHWPNVRQFNDVTKLRGEDVGPVDVICGGFPCQDISHAGKGAGLQGERSGLWREYLRLIGEIRPSIVIVENVSALLGRGLDRVLGDLAAIGYDAEWHCIPASAVGAPHIRDRIWIIANPQHSDADRAGSYRAPVYLIGNAEPGNEQEREPGSRGAVLADPNGEGLEGRVGKSLRERSGQQPARTDNTPLANADECEPEGRSSRFGRGQRIEAVASAECGRGYRSADGQWLAEPDVGRVAHGVPSRVDRLRALGNAVVPQIPELIGRAILQARFHLTQTTEGNCQ